jgi:signal transduction histidine kinase
MTTEESPAELRYRIQALTVENARLSEAVAARDTFLAVAAHELRNTMTPHHKSRINVTPHGC